MICELGDIDWAATMGVPTSLDGRRHGAPATCRLSLSPAAHRCHPPRMAISYSPELVDLVGRAKEARDFLAELCETDDGAEEIDRAAVLLESLERALAPFEGEE